MEKKEITNRADIKLLVDRFYEKVQVDDRIGYIFNDIAKVDWSKHLPTMYDFWESLLLEGGNYRGNSMAPHFRINQLIPLESAHFDRWISLFEGTVNELFKGENADLAITRARSIKDIMAYKMNQINHPDDNNKKIPLINPGS